MPSKAKLKQKVKELERQRVNWMRSAQKWAHKFDEFHEILSRHGYGVGDVRERTESIMVELSTLKQSEADFNQAFEGLRAENNELKAALRLALFIIEGHSK
jgi:uncharacterized coiled-coil DUF342 family protein